MAAIVENLDNAPCIVPRLLAHENSDSKPQRGQPNLGTLSSVFMAMSAFNWHQLLTFYASTKFRFVRNFKL